MSFEINPVLAGKFDAPDYASTNNNIAQTPSADDVSGPDSRRYTQFDRSATEAGSTTTFSFSDLVDMLNPLEHIPVVSSIYRAVTGEQINPVSRVAGDILYGGVLGAASAVFGGVSAVADAGLESQTGKDSGGLTVAALFGSDDDKKSSVQLADAGTPAATAATPTPSSSTKTIELAQAMNGTPLLAAAALPDNTPGTTDASAAAPPNVPPSKAVAFGTTAVTPQSAPIASVTPTTANPVATPAVLQTTALAASVSPVAAASVDSSSSGLGAIPLAKSSATSGKQAFGGVMGPGNTGAQDMALALEEGAPGMRMGHMIYTNKLVNGQHPMPARLSSGGTGLKLLAPVVAPAPALPAAFAVPTGPAASANFSSTGQMLTSATASPADASQGNKLPAAMLQDMMMKALSQYGNAAAAPPSTPGSMLNLVN